jgi:vanillate O-demethylase monooxygenase subunit
MFVKNCWYMAGWSHEFNFEPLVARIFLNEAIVLYRATNGRLIAMEDRCCHRLAPLSAGRVEGDDLRCLYHGLRFGPDGQCNEIPQQPGKPVSKVVRVRTYPVVEKHGAAWIWMGEPARAVPDLIPSVIGPDEGPWSMLPGQMTIEANYSLLNDNLLDLTHVAYVHRNSFGRGKEDQTAEFAGIPSVTTRLDNGIRVERWMPNDLAPPYIAEILPGMDKVDFYICTDLLIPGILILNSRIYKSGSIDRCSTAGLEGEEPIYAEYSCQAITPVNKSRTTYFFALGPWRQHEHLKQMYLALGQLAFSEDRAMLEAQQKVIDRTPDRGMMNLAADQAVASFRSKMNALMKEETTEE